MHLTQVRRDSHGRTSWRKVCQTRGVPFIVVHRRQSGCHVEWEGTADLATLDGLGIEGDASYSADHGKARGLSVEAAESLAKRLAEVLKANPVKSLT